HRGQRRGGRRVPRGNHPLRSDSQRQRPHAGVRARRPRRGRHGRGADAAGCAFAPARPGTSSTPRPMITLLAFILTLGVLIVIHEYGHYRVAVACGVKVLRFSVGFGRTLWRHQATPDSTEFVVAALPFGGYVKMLDEREEAVRPEERHRAFNRRPLWQRTAIVSAGPIANLLLAVVLYAASNWIGVD